MNIKQKVSDLEKSLDVLQESFKNMAVAVNETKNDVSVFCFSVLKHCADIDRVKFDFSISLEDKGFDTWKVLVEFDEDQETKLCKDHAILDIQPSAIRLFMAESYSSKEIEDIMCESDFSDTLYSIVRDFIIKEY